MNLALRWDDFGTVLGSFWDDVCISLALFFIELFDSFIHELFEARGVFQCGHDWLVQIGRVFKVAKQAFHWIANYFDELQRCEIR